MFENNAIATAEEIAKDYGVALETIIFVQHWEPEVYSLMEQNNPSVWGGICFESTANYSDLDSLADAYGYDSINAMMCDYYVVDDAGLNGYYLVVE